jgi:hypothetical protein
MRKLELFNNQTENGDSSEVDFAGGRLHLIATGDFDGAKIKYQVSYDKGQNYHDYLIQGNEVFIQSVSGKGFYAIEDDEVKIRAVLSDAGTNTDITVRGYYNQYYSAKYNLIGVS